MPFFNSSSPGPAVDNKWKEHCHVNGRNIVMYGWLVQGRSQSFGIDEVRSAIAEGASRKEREGGGGGGLGHTPKKILKSESSYFV